MDLVGFLLLNFDGLKFALGNIGVPFDDRKYNSIPPLFDKFEEKPIANNVLYFIVGCRCSVFELAAFPPSRAVCRKAYHSTTDENQYLALISGTLGDLRDLAMKLCRSDAPALRRHGVALSKLLISSVHPKTFDDCTKKDNGDGTYQWSCNDCG